MRKIKIYPGDVIVSDSRYRYYVDNTLLEANNRYKYTRSTEGFLVFKPSVDPKEIRVWVKALNALGVSPRDLISIFQAIKAAVALQAKLEVI